MRSIVSLFAVAVSLALLAPCAHATGMVGQPKPTVPVLSQTMRAASDIIALRGDPAVSRPKLLTLIDSNPTVDLVDSYSPALRDDNTYTAVMATYEDALAAAKDDTAKKYIRFNTLKAILARAAYLPTTARRDLLTRSQELAEDLANTNRQDAAVWEAAGDLSMLNGDAKDAALAYDRMGSATGGSMARAKLKTGRAYASIRAYGPAQAAYQAGIGADVALGSAKGGKEMRHLLYQGLTSLYLAQGRDKDAVAALLLSAKVTQDPDQPYSLRTDLAYTLLKRGYVKEVRDYAAAALRLDPDDINAKQLQSQAGVK